MIWVRSSVRLGDSLKIRFIAFINIFLVIRCIVRWVRVVFVIEKVGKGLLLFRVFFMVRTSSERR